ncbi:MAG: GntR family transcriptional regulator [Anaerolineae bacterium]|nr:GntR family transcriptional regulator [Anaerolineae bacterium]MDH7472471.1 GntR family transcriptional regulator [Anaerolineae bacterium]
MIDEANDTIDRDSYEPAYAQLVRILRRQIATGVFRPGDRLPSEAQLCERYGVSPMTVRRVINILADQGVVVAEQGRGTFVKPLELGTAIFDLDRLQQLFRDESQSQVKLLEVRIVPATERTARKLAIEVGERTIFIRRLIFQGENPMLLHREYVLYDPTRPIIEAEMEVTSLRGLFMGGNESALKWGDLAIDATVLTDDEATLLHSEVGAAAFRLEHIFYDFDNRPVSWGWFICPGDRLRFTAKVGIHDQETNNP